MSRGVQPRWLIGGFLALRCNAARKIGINCPTASRLFVKLPKINEQEDFTADGTCHYWFDSDYDGGSDFLIGNGLLALDVSQLSAGVHTVHFQTGGTALPPVSSSLFVILPIKGNNEDMIIGYDYWLNDSHTPTSVRLPEPSPKLSLISLLPVAEQPFRSCCFYFAIEENQPVLYAKNDIRLRFYSSEAHFTDLTAQYVDYSVKEQVADIKPLEPYVRQTEQKPAGNEIIWYSVAAEAGDLLRFRLDRAATIQLFSPTGHEVYAANLNYSWQLQEPVECFCF